MRVLRSLLVVMIAAGFAAGIVLAGSVSADSLVMLMIASSVLAVIAALSLVLVATARFQGEPKPVSVPPFRAGDNAAGSARAGKDFAHSGTNAECLRSTATEDSRLGGSLWGESTAGTLEGASDRGLGRVSGEQPAWEVLKQSPDGLAAALQNLVGQALAVFGARRVEVWLADLSTGGTHGEPKLVASAESNPLVPSQDQSVPPPEPMRSEPIPRATACFAQPLLFAGSSLGVVKVWIPSSHIDHDADANVHLGVKRGLGLFAREILLVVMSDWYASHRSAAGSESQARTGFSFLDHFSEAVAEPVGIVLAGIEFLIAGECGDLTAAQRQSIEILRTDARKLRGVVQDVATYKKIVSGVEQASSASFDAWETVHAVIGSLRGITERKAHTVVFAERSEEPLYALCDPHHFRCIVLALIKNALIYTPPGGTVSVSLSRESDGKLLFSVRDTGIGISPEELSSIPQPFQRGKHPYARMQSGVGLGLVLARELVKLQGGELAISSVTGEGTECSFSVPQGVQPLLPSGLTDDDAHLRGEDAHILFVQPEETDVVFLIPYLERRGCRVSVASAEDGARRLLQQEEIALVMLTDLFEPHASSSLGRFAREEAQGRQISVVLLTRRDFLLTDERYRAEDLDRCFVRPIDMEMLFTACSAMVRQKRPIPADAV